MRTARVSRVGPGADFEPLHLAPGARVFVLTGAGISAESGLRTFRDADGLWETYPVEQVATPEAFHEDPARVWRFYSERRQQAAAVAPNAAHRALAALEARLGERLFLCTQNVDPLHERAGSRRVWHMHGELFTSRCERWDPERGGAETCRPFADERLYLHADALPRCACGGAVRPHICWFGEQPYGMDRITEALHTCDLFLTVGSSGAVYPAAGFVEALRQPRHARPVRAIYLGTEVPENARAFDECRLGKAGALLPGLFDLQG